MRILPPLMALLFLAMPAFSATFGTVVARPASFSDIVLDEARHRLYLANIGARQIDVFSIGTTTPQLSTSIKTSGTPYSAAMSRSGKFLYVASYESASLDIIDL